METSTKSGKIDTLAIHGEMYGNIPLCCHLKTKYKSNRCQKVLINYNVIINYNPIISN